MIPNHFSYSLFGSIDILGIDCTVIKLLNYQIVGGHSHPQLLAGSVFSQQGVPCVNSEDLHLWEPRVRRGGIVAGHDFTVRHCQ